MVVPTVGAIVLVPFPFSDLSQTKLRPAVALAPVGRSDWILCQITSKPYGDLRVVRLSSTSFKSGSLRDISYVRPGKLFTANQSLIVSQVGVLTTSSLRQIIKTTVTILQSSLKP